MIMIVLLLLVLTRRNGQTRMAIMMMARTLVVLFHLLFFMRFGLEMRCRFGRLLFPRSLPLFLVGCVTVDGSGCRRSKCTKGAVMMGGRNNRSVFMV